MPHYRKYTYDTSFFDVIDTEAKAYWLGFIYAEGNVYKNTLTLKLGSEDSHWVYAFRNALNANNPVTTILKKDGKFAHYVKINSKNIIEQLAKLGVFPCKSASITLPNIDETLLRHFMRGFIDGDGWISNKGNAWNIGIGTTSKTFAEQFQMYVQQITGQTHKITVCKKSKPRKTFYQIVTSGDGARLLAKELYTNAKVYLPRKFERYQFMSDCYQKRIESKSAPYKGVCIDNGNGKWKSYVQYKGKKHILGWFENQVDAAKAYNLFILSKNDIPKSKLNTIP